VLVVDASVVAPVVADGGDDGDRYRNRIRGESLAVPDLLRIEVMSVLRRQLRSGAIDRRQADEALDDLLVMPFVVYPTAPLLRRGWALRDNLTAYDACYAALAELLGCTLVTADARLARAPAICCAVEVP
jgi:predicted nucleic acid-binding protein